MCEKNIIFFHPVHLRVCDSQYLVCSGLVVTELGKSLRRTPHQMGMCLLLFGERFKESWRTGEGCERHCAPVWRSRQRPQNRGGFMLPGLFRGFFLLLELVRICKNFYTVFGYEFSRRNLWKMLDSLG